MATDQITLMHRLGFDRFHLVGHDRGARTGHRMALDRPEMVESLAVLDIPLTYTMFMDTNRHVAAKYWHWYFLSLPAPFPERMIGADPDYFFETCFETWGNTPVSTLDPNVLAQYRRSWRDPHGGDPVPPFLTGGCPDVRSAALKWHRRAMGG